MSQARADCGKAIRTGPGVKVPGGSKAKHWRLPVNSRRRRYGGGDPAGDRGANLRQTMYLSRSPPFAGVMESAHLAQAMEERKRDGSILVFVDGDHSGGLMSLEGGEPLDTRAQFYEARSDLRRRAASSTLLCGSRERGAFAGLVSGAAVRGRRRGPVRIVSPFGRRCQGQPGPPAKTRRARVKARRRSPRGTSGFPRRSCADRVRSRTPRPTRSARTPALAASSSPG